MPRHSLTAARHGGSHTLVFARTAVRRYARRLVLLAGLAAAGCGFGTAAVVSATSDGSSSTAQTVASSLLAPRSATSPASIFFVLTDQEGDAADVEISYRRAGGAFQPIRLAPGSQPLSRVPASPNAYKVLWDFASDLGGEGLHEGIELQLRVKGGISPPPLTGVVQGNDAPTVSIVPPPPEVSGIAALRFLVADSSADAVDVRVDFATDADPQFRTARPAGIDPMTASPAVALAAATSSTTGSSLTFFWDTATARNAPEIPGDLVGLDVVVHVRLTVIDAAGANTTAVATFRVDNDIAPLANLGDEFLVNPDDRRGIPVPVHVSDDGPQVRVLLQWRNDNQPDFPPLLPGDPAIGTAPVASSPEQLAAWCSDPAFLRERQICLPFPAFVRGTCAPVGDLLRIEEFAGKESRIPARGLAGLPLDLMRLRRFQSLAGTWGTNPIHQPVAAMPLGNGTTALVLDRPGGASRLVELDLARGVILRVLATGLVGTPTALTIDPAARTALVATDSSGAWTLFSIRLDEAAPTPQIVANGGGGAAPQGPLRGLLADGTNSVLATAEDSLWRVRWGSVATTTRLAGGFSTPWGLAADPLRNGHILIGERSANRVTSYGLDDDSKIAIAAANLGGGAALPEPTSIAVERVGDGVRLLALCATAAPPNRQVRAVELGHTPAPIAATLAIVAPDASAIATGTSGLILVASPTASDLIAHGGVEQTRIIAAYDPIARQVTLDEPAAPPARKGQEWRVPLSLPVFGLTDVGTTAFVWDTTSIAFGDSIRLRAIVADTEFGTADATSVSRRIRSYDTATSPAPAGATQPSIADIDGDGALDFTSVNQQANTVSIRFHDTTGPRSFVAIPDLALPAGDLFVAATTGDFDGDGDGDIACLGFLSGTIRFFVQTAPRSFQLAPQSIATGSGPVAMVAADFDGDGQRDLATCSIGDNKVRMHRHTGPGFAFATAESAAFPQAVTGLCAADTDGDGRVELATIGGAGTGSTIRFFAWSSPSLTTTQTASLVAQANRITVADLDGDADADVVCSDPTKNELVPLYRTSSGALEPAEVLPTDVGPTRVFVADLDGDDDADIACSCEGSGTINVFQQRTYRAYLAQQGIESAGLNGLALGDLDGDGALDLLATTFAGQSAFTTYFADATRTFSAIPEVVTGNGPNFLVAADVDRDGDSDLITADAGASTVTVLQQAATRAFAAAATLSTTSSIPASVVAADLDGDADVDLLSCNKGVADPGSVTIFENVGAGSFTRRPPLLAGNRPTNAAAADLDGNGTQDLVVVNEVSDNVSIFLQTAPLTFALAMTLPAGDRPEFVTAADLDADGRTDFVVSNRAANTLTVFRQTTPMVFAPTTLPVGAFPANTEIADIDGDGDLDLICANEDSLTVSILLQTATGTFTAQTPLATDGGPTNVRVLDLDGDGDLDLATSNKTGSLTIYTQDAAAGSTSASIFERQPVVVTGGEPLGIVAGDLDGDGDADLAVVLRNQSTVRILYGKSR